jgi:hypothetical protein
LKFELVVKGKVIKQGDWKCIEHYKEEEMKIQKARANFFSIN